MKHFNWLFVGCGGIAYAVGKNLKGSDNNIYAVYGRKKEKSEAFAKKFKCKSYVDLDSALQDEGVDGVYICTTNDSHYELAKKCIIAGKPVLLEKPMTLTKDETEELFRIAEENNVYLSEAMWTWHNKTALKVKEWIDNGEIGDVKSVKSKFAIMLYWLRNKNSRLLNPARGGGCLYDLGVYPIRYMYELFGMPDSYNCASKMYNGVDEDSTFTAKYPSFEAKLHIAMHTFKGEHFEVVGTKGSIKVPFFHCTKKAVLKNDKGVTTYKDDTKFGLYANEFTNVANEITSGLKTSAYIKKDASIAVMGILEDCIKKMNE